ARHEQPLGREAAERESAMVEAEQVRAAPQPETGGALGLPQATALIVGSIIGVGIFNLPFSLASIGPFLMAGAAFLLGIPVYLSMRTRMTEPAPVPPPR